MRHRCFALGLSAALLLAGFTLVCAEYPDRPITLIANYSAGGGADLSSRALAKKAEKFLGQPIAVVNKPGAAGTIGVGALAASRPDGYTIGVTTSGTLTMGPHIYDLPYDPFKSFDFIMGYGRYMYGPCVRSDSQFKTLKDLVTYAKANPGKVKFSHIGLASPNHFSMMMLAKAENIQWEPVIFKETTAAVTACLGGHVDVVSQNPGDVVPYIKAGRLRLLASMCDGRWEWVPDVPTVRELGYNFDVEAWLGLGLPTGAPKPVLDKLRDAFKKSMDDPEFQDVMKKIYIPAAYRSAEEYRKLIEVTYPQYERIIKELGLHKSQQKKKS